MKTNLFKIFITLFIIGIIPIMNINAQSKNKGTLKILSYNVYWGMKLDTTVNKSHYAKWIKELDPDIVAFQEMNGFTQKDQDFAPKGTANPNDLQKLAASYGHPYVFIVREPSPDGSISFPVALTSKYPIVNVRRILENCVHGVLIAEIEGFHFAVTHFHPFSSEKRGYEIDQILATVKSEPTDWKWFLIGDLNSVSPLDKSAYADNKLRDFIRQDRIKRPHNKNLGKDDELDYSVQQRILDFGFVDALKLFYPQFIATAPTKVFYDQSTYSLRYDYLYVSRNMQKDVIDCHVIKDQFTDTYSDHYPVVITVKR